MEQPLTTIQVRKSAAAPVLQFAQKIKRQEGTAARVTYERLLAAGLKALKGAKEK